MKYATRMRLATGVARAVVFLWDFVKLSLFMVGLVFVALRVAGMLDIGNFVFYYGPDHAYLVKEYRN